MKLLDATLLRPPNVIFVLSVNVIVPDDPACLIASATSSAE